MMLVENCHPVEAENVNMLYFHTFCAEYAVSKQLLFCYINCISYLHCYFLSRLRFFCFHPPFRRNAEHQSLRTAASSRPKGAAKRCETSRLPEVVQKKTTKKKKKTSQQWRVIQHEAETSNFLKRNRRKHNFHADLKVYLVSHRLFSCFLSSYNTLLP